jgi:hypothetical protein
VMPWINWSRVCLKEEPRKVFIANCRTRQPETFFRQFERSSLQSNIFGVERRLSSRLKPTPHAKAFGSSDNNGDFNGSIFQQQASGFRSAVYSRIQQQSARHCLRRHYCRYLGQYHG